MDLYLALVNDWDSLDSQVCATLEDAKHWLAHEGIPAEAWQTFYDALKDKGTLTSDRSGMTPAEILAAWAEPCSQVEPYLFWGVWGDGEYRLSIEKQRVYSRE